MFEEDRLGDEILDGELSPSVLQLSREEDKRVLLMIMKMAKTPKKEVDKALKEWDQETEKMILKKYGRMPI